MVLMIHSQRECLHHCNIMITLLAFYLGTVLILFWMSVCGCKSYVVFTVLSHELMMFKLSRTKMNTSYIRGLTTSTNPLIYSLFQKNFLLELVVIFGSVGCIITFIAWLLFLLLTLGQGSKRQNQYLMITNEGKGILCFSHVCVIACFS